LKSEEGARRRARRATFLPLSSVLASTGETSRAQCRETPGRLQRRRGRHREKKKEKSSEKRERAPRRRRRRKADFAFGKKKNEVHFSLSKKRKGKKRTRKRIAWHRPQRAPAALPPTRSGRAAASCSRFVWCRSCTASTRRGARQVRSVKVF